MQSTRKNIYNSSSLSKDLASQSVLNYPAFSPPNPYDIMTRYISLSKIPFFHMQPLYKHTHTHTHTHTHRPHDFYAYQCSQSVNGSLCTQPAGLNIAHKGKLRVYLLRVLRPGKEKTHGKTAIMQDKTLEGAKTDLYK